MVAVDQPAEYVRGLCRAGFLSEDRVDEWFLDWLDSWIRTLREIRLLPEVYS